VKPQSVQLRSVEVYAAHLKARSRTSSNANNTCADHIIASDLKLLKFMLNMNGPAPKVWPALISQPFIEIDKMFEQEIGLQCKGTGFLEIVLL
jgi:hypothetical protein